jgi:hypothetical protein
LKALLDIDFSHTTNSRSRLSSLYSDDLEEAARWNLAFLGKLERPSLTALEEKLLAVLEA